MINPTVQFENQAMLSRLAGADPLQKEAELGNLKDVLVTYAQEDGLLRKIFGGPQKVSEADLDEQFDFWGPCIVRNMLPRCNFAVSVPVGNVPVNTYFNMPKYRILFDRIMGRRFKADVARLRMYRGDIKQVFNDLMLKQVLQEEDRKWTAIKDTILGFSTAEAAARGVDVATGGSANNYAAANKARVTNTGARGAIDLGGAISQATITLLSKGLPSTTNRLEGRTAVINNVTSKDFGLFTHNGIGQLAADLFTKGFANVSTPFQGLDWVVTIKSDLVPDNLADVYVDPKMLGEFCLLDDVAIYVETKGHDISMWCEEMVGISLANDGGVCKGYFGGTAGTWK
jgi:hypothetical protein